MPPDWIAETTWVALDVAGGREPLIVRIARPVACGPDEWECALALHGLHATLIPVRGNDALQALGLAWELVGRLLRAFVANGGRLEYETGDAVDLDAYFAAAPPPESTSR